MLRVRFGLSLVLLLVLAGCGAAPVGILPLASPDLLPFAVPIAANAQATKITLTPDDPINDYKPGNVVDDLSGLDGCWGWYGQTSLNDAAPPLFAVSYAYSFDLTARKATAETLTRSLLGIVAGGRIQYNIDTVEKDRIVLRVDAAQAAARAPLLGPSAASDVKYDPQNGLSITGAADFFGDGAFAGTVYSEVLVITRVGDRFVLYSPVDDRHYQGLVFTRLDCPK